MYDNPKTYAGITLGEQLGSGGMAAVYQAKIAGQDVAVKIPRQGSDLAATSDIIRREIRCYDHLGSSPLIVPIYDSCAGEEPYLIMPILPYDLAEYIDLYGHLTGRTFVDVARQCASGLVFIAQHGMIHNDIKPNHFFAAVASEPKFCIGDFGLASCPELGLSMELGDGTFRGTPAYASSQRAKAEPPDARDDIYALGIMFYFIATGKLPFNQEDPLQVLMQQINTDIPPVTDQQAEFSVDLCHLIQQMVAKDRDARPQQAAEIVARLESHTLEMDQ